MPVPWEAPIKQSKQLTVFAGPDLLKAPAWGAQLFKAVLDDFNRLAKVNKLGVTLVESKVAPDENTAAGANVQIEAATGTVTFTSFGKKFSAFLSQFAMEGGTALIPQGGPTRRAFIFVPINPMTGFTSDARGVGDGVKLSQAVHELLHACGLLKTDPGHNRPEPNPDLFLTDTFFKEGAQPSDDRIELGFHKFLPPTFLNPRTARLIRSNWS